MEKGLIDELVEGRDLAWELQLNLSNEPKSSTNEAHVLMVQSILAKFERSLQILQNDSKLVSTQVHKPIMGKVESPSSYNGSPKSQDSDGDFKVNNKNDSRKRRNSPRVTQRVEGCTSSGLEGPIEDGFNWRKYGQKEILGAKFTRAYYRCTYKQIQGCPATKQVQRCEDDPSFFQVSYRGEHTCSHTSSSSSSSFPNNPNNTTKLEPFETLSFNSSHHPHQQYQNIVWDFKRDNVLNHHNSSSFAFTTNNPLVNTNFVPKENVCYDDAMVQPATASTDLSPSIASELLFDFQAEIENDFSRVL
ncbi:unnamed protein product [Amaranthus hypochondriacus]